MVDFLTVHIVHVGLDRKRIVHTVFPHYVAKIRILTGSDKRREILRCGMDSECAEPLDGGIQHHDLRIDQYTVHVK